MKNRTGILSDGFITVILLTGAFVLCLNIQSAFESSALIPLIFNLSVFLISRFTDGYSMGIIASLVSVLAVNYAFTFPHFRFNFTIFENFLSAVILLIVTIMTSMMTTRIKVQEQRRREMEMEQLRADLLRAISHDLRTPLTSIYGTCEAVLANGELPERQRRELVEGIRSDAKWLIDMVENLLSVTRIEGGALNLSVKSTPVEELTDVVVRKFKDSHPDTQLEVVLPEEFVSVSIDPLLIGQVLLNLLDNATQHARGMTLLRYEVRSEEGHICFRVTDDGCGMEEAELKKLFSGMPKRDDRPADGKKRNMGIGLYVCAAIIKAHGGSIRAENRVPHGLSVSFRLPAEVASDE